MNIQLLSATELAKAARIVATALNRTDIVSVNSSLRADLVAAIGTLPETLAAQAADAAVAEGIRKAAVSSRNETRKQVRDLMTRVRKALEAGFASKEQYDICGFHYPATPAALYIPHDPSDLAVVGYSNNANRGRFKGNNKPNSVNYEIWRRQHAAGQWIFLRSVSKQSFIDTPVTPGQTYEYRVRAVARQAVSNFSNTAVVYGSP
jgi:hypothetical protein